MNTGNTSTKFSQGRKKMEIADGFRLTWPLGSKAQFTCHCKHMMGAFPYGKGWHRVRSTGYHKQGIRVLSQELPARQETGLLPPWGLLQSSSLQAPASHGKVGNAVPVLHLPCLLRAAWGMPCRQTGDSISYPGSKCLCTPTSQGTG